MAFVKLMIGLGAGNAALAVLLGAFGAHGLKGRLSDELMSTFQTGVEYHFYHALGLLAVAFVSNLLPESGLIRWSGWAMVLGIVLFSGSLYVLSFTGLKGFGAVTPFGGMSFVAAWILMLVAVLKS